MANEHSMEAMVWAMRDERVYSMLERKYTDRKKLAAEAEDARKLAEKNQTIDGKPNPLLPMLLMRAEIAQLRFEMSYIIDKNTHLGSIIETVDYLHTRIGIAEGAYAHVKMLAEGNRIDYVVTKELHAKLTTFLKEQADAKDHREPARPDGKS